MPDPVNSPVKYIVRLPTFKTLGKREESEPLENKVFTEEVAKYSKFYTVTADGKLDKEVTDLDEGVRTALASRLFDLGNTTKEAEDSGPEVMTVDEYKAMQQKYSLLVGGKRAEFSEDKSYNYRLGYEAAKPVEPKK